MYGRVVLPRHRSPVGAVLVTALFVVAPPTDLRSQDAPPDPDHAAGFFQVGWMGLDLDALNGSLVGAGYPALSEDFLTLGGGGYGMRGRFLLGGEGHAVVTSEETTADGATQLQVGGGYGLFRVGYLAYSMEGFDAFPMVGIGGGGLALTLLDRSAPTFGEVLADPGRSSTLSTGMFLLDASILLNYRIRTGDDEPESVADDGEARERGLLVGIQTGYTFSPGTPSWRLDAINSVAGGPELEIEGFYARFSIGGWGGGS